MHSNDNPERRKPRVQWLFNCRSVDPGDKIKPKKTWNHEILRFEEGPQSAPLQKDLEQHRPLGVQGERAPSVDYQDEVAKKEGGSARQQERIR